MTDSSARGNSSKHAPLSDSALPPLALALGAATSSLLYLEEHEAELRDGFIPAVAAMDRADRAYRGAIEEALPPEPAGAMLSMMAAFRERVHEIREQTRNAIGDIYRRYDRCYGRFDPLDPLAPPAEGFTPADATRVATIGGSAREKVDALRAHMSEAIAKRLLPSQIDALIVAKRRRRDAFVTELKQALEGALSAHPTVTAAEIDKAARQLTQLAEGWY
ncbi:hypothetical protein EPN44_07860 [bacterium]|nr:MAG: hypothetical protein EPN44_07860 [bacterium]